MFFLIVHRLAPLGLAVLLPLNATGNALPDTDGVAALSLSNIPSNSSVLWMHGIYAIFCTFVTFMILYQFYDKVFKL
jgi:hypothetical protein